jgi:hypothetical protein
MAIQRITSGIIADGAIVATDIADGIVTNDKLAGSITSDKITSVSNTAISGLIQAAQIGSANASVINAGTLAKARLPTGSVLQVVYAQANTTVSTTSTSYVDTGFSASITPTSATSKILIFGSAIIRVGTGSNNYQHTIFRNGTTDLAPSATRGFIQCRDASNNQSDYTPAFAHLDSPATTSAITYNWYHKSEGGVSVSFSIDNSFAQLTLMEIAA